MTSPPKLAAKRARSHILNVPLQDEPTTNLDTKNILALADALQGVENTIFCPYNEKSHTVV